MSKEKIVINGIVGYCDSMINVINRYQEHDVANDYDLGKASAFMQILEFINEIYDGGDSND